MVVVMVALYSVTELSPDSRGDRGGVIWYKDLKVLALYKYVKQLFGPLC